MLPVWLPAALGRKRRSAEEKNIEEELRRQSRILRALQQ